MLKPFGKTFFQRFFKRSFHESLVYWGAKLKMGIRKKYLSWTIRMINPLGHIFPHHLLMARFLLSLKGIPFILWAWSTKFICIIHFVLSGCQVQINNLANSEQFCKAAIVNCFWGAWITTLATRSILIQTCLYHRSKYQRTSRIWIKNMAVLSEIHCLFWRCFSESVKLFMWIIVHDHTKSLDCYCQHQPHNTIAGFWNYLNFSGWNTDPGVQGRVHTGLH